MKDYTVKEIAELLDVSKPTVQKVINDLSIEPVRIEKNKFRFYSYADTVGVIKAIKPDFEFEKLQNVCEKSQNETEKPKSEFEKLQNETEKQPNQTEKSQTETEKPKNNGNSEELELVRSMLALIQEQLKEKDNQLAIKDKQIQDLNDRLAEAMELTRGQQYITAADKTAQLMEKTEVEDVIVSEEKEQMDKTAAAATYKEAADNEDKPPQKKGFLSKLFGR